MGLGRERIVPAAVFGCLAVCLFLFLVIANKVAAGEIRQFDERFLLLFRDPADPSRMIGPSWLLEVALNLTALGSTAVIVLTLVLVVGFLLVTGRFGPALFTFISVWFGWLISSVLKHLYDRARPDLVDHFDTVRTASFPSGHAMMSTVIYLTLAVLVIRFFGDMRVRVYVLCVAILVSGLVGISRVMLGVHWPSDVIAGWSLGVAWACFLWLAVAILRRWARGQGA